jgi:hypothetical protein
MGVGYGGEIVGSGHGEMLIFCRVTGRQFSIGVKFRENRTDAWGSFSLNVLIETDE